jgi:hypothetical protein
MEVVKSELLSIPRKIKSSIVNSLVSVVTDTVCIPIKQCRHYCGFRYGSDSFNPYENYITGLHKRQPINKLKKDFEDFLIFYRPQNFGDIFNIKFSKHIPLWIYPWQYGYDFNPNNGWLEDINKVPDIITHFCKQGIKKSRIEEEYFWLERAYNLMKQVGYQPENNSCIQVFELKKKKESVFIVKDGNHRLSSLSALGYKEVIVKRYLLEGINETNYKNWHQIKISNYSEQDALMLFNTYILGVNDFKRAVEPGKII